MIRFYRCVWSVLTELSTNHDLRHLRFWLFWVGMISSMRVNARKGMQSLKSTWSSLHSDLKDRVLHTLERNNRGGETKRTHVHTCCSERIHKREERSNPNSIWIQIFRTCFQHLPQKPTPSFCSLEITN